MRFSKDILRANNLGVHAGVVVVMHWLVCLILRIEVGGAEPSCHWLRLQILAGY